MRRVAGILVALGVLVALVALVRHTNSGAETVTFRGLFGDLVELDRRQLALGLSLGFTLLGGWLAGELLATLGLPRVSGYLAFGIGFGPVAGLIGSGLEPLIPAAHRGPLAVVDSLAISLIALMAGGELHIRTIRRSIRAAIGTAVGEVALVLVPIAAGIALFGGRIESLAGLSEGELLVVGSVIGLLAVGNSPAIVIAVLKETRARGPMRDAVLTTTITKDLLQIAVAAGLFAIGAAALSDAAATPGDPASSISWHLLGSLGVGAVIGLLSRWPAERAGERIGLVTAGLGVTIAAVSAAAGLSPLLVGLAAGLMQANLWPERSARLFRSTQDIFLPVSVVFFANAGASIDVTALGLVWPVAVGLVATRLLLMWTAVTAGMRWAGVPARASRWAWTGFIAQAGVSLALAREFEATFAGFPFTVTVTTLLVAIIAIHELIGPPLFAWGLRRAGEVPEDSA